VSATNIVPEEKLLVLFSGYEISSIVFSFMFRMGKDSFFCVC
jgi:hypothetical protein